jgi:hypothetical protein
MNTLVDAINNSIATSVFVNVKDALYGATGDGTTNDRAAIQAAIDAVELAGGGTVFIPAGTYKVQITETGDDTHCLTIAANYVRLLGEPGTVLDCFPYGGDPDTHWQVADGAVWRGGGIFVAGGASYATRRRGVIIENIEIDGNFTYTGDHTWPVPIETGLGWDITHKGIWYQNDLYHDNHVVRDCHVHNFSGEIVYSGGSDDSDEPYLGTFTVEDNLLHDSNGSVVSIGGKVCRTLRNDIHTCVCGIENSSKTGWQEIAYNRVRDTTLDSIVLVCYGEENGGADIHHNRIKGSDSFGIGLMSAWNTKCHHNTIIDCEDGGIRQEVGSGYPNDWSQDVAVTDNLILADRVNVAIGINMGFDTAQVRRNRVMRNTITRTEYAADNSKIVSEPYSNYPNTDLAQVDCRENLFYGTHGDNTAATCYDTLLTTTGNQYPVTFKPPVEAYLRAGISIRVVTGATDVTIKIHDGTDYVATVLATATLAVGVYSYPAYQFRGLARGNASIEVNPSVANQVYVTATIREA